MMTRQELREVIEAALPDPTIFFVENEEHASDYWRRQAIRVEAAITEVQEVRQSRLPIAVRDNTSYRPKEA